MTKGLGRKLDEIQQTICTHYGPEAWPPPAAKEDVEALRAHVAHWCEELCEGDAYDLAPLNDYYETLERVNGFDFNGFTLFGATPGEFVSSLVQRNDELDWYPHILLASYDDELLTYHAEDKQFYCMECTPFMGEDCSEDFHGGLSYLFPYVD